VSQSRQPHLTISRHDHSLQEGHTNHEDPVGYLESGFPFQILQSPTFDDINHIENQRVLVEASPYDFCQWELGISILTKIRML